MSVPFKAEVNIRTSRAFWDEILPKLDENFDGLTAEKDQIWADFCLNYAYEVGILFGYARRVFDDGGEPSISLANIRFAGKKQAIIEFAVNDMKRINDPTQTNWHGQNTSRWAYAGAIVVSLDTGNVSCHH